jgi:LacI family transcriptional regulator
MGVLHTLTDRGLRAGADIAVTGFDDSQVAQTVPPGLTSVRQPLEEVAVGVVRYLDELLAHRPIPEPGCVLTPTLSVRGTS